MNAVLAEVLTAPVGSVSPWQQAVSPIIVAPAHPGREHRTIGRVVVQIGIAINLVLDGPLVAKTGFVSVRLGVDRGDALRVPRIIQATEIGKRQIGESSLQ